MQGTVVLWSNSSWEVGGSNPDKSMSFSPGCRLDLTCLFFWMRRILAEWPINSEKKEWIWIINFKCNCNINIIWNSEIQVLDGHKKKTIHYGLPTLKFFVSNMSDGSTWIIIWIMWLPLHFPCFISFTTTVSSDMM